MVLMCRAFPSLGPSITFLRVLIQLLGWHVLIDDGSPRSPGLICHESLTTTYTEIIGHHQSSQEVEHSTTGVFIFYTLCQAIMLRQLS